MKLAEKKTVDIEAHTREQNKMPVNLPHPGWLIKGKLCFLTAFSADLPAVSVFVIRMA